MLDTTKRKPDYPLLTVIGILVPLGLVMVYSSSFVDAFTNHDNQLYYAWRQFGGAQDIPSAVAFHLGKRDQLAHAAVRVAPDPPVDRPQHPIDARGALSRHRDCP